MSEPFHFLIPNDRKVLLESGANLPLQLGIAEISHSRALLIVGEIPIR